MHHWIDDTATLEARCADLAGAPRIGLDTEFMRVDRYWPRLALIQCEGGGRIDLIDPLALDDLEPVGAWLRAPRPAKIMHGASEDLVALAPIAGAPIAGLFDTQIAAAFAGFGAGIGYQRLCAELLGIEVEKGEQRSDWLRRPLSERQRHYAANDVRHLEALHERLLERLEHRGMLAWALADCERLAQSAEDAAEPENPHHDFRSLWRWPIERQARLARLLAWREATARRLDRPRSWLLDNPTAVDLVEREPKSPGELAARLASMRGFPKRQLGALFDLLSAPLTDADLAITPIPPPLDPAEEDRFEALRAAVARIAGELDLPAALLAPRRVLERVARDPATPALDGWRRAVLADAIASI